MKKFATAAVIALASLVLIVPVRAQQIGDFFFFVSQTSGTAYDLGVDADDNLYVVNGGDLLVVAPDGTPLTTLTSGLFDQPRGVAIDPATGDLYVANYGNGSITKVTGATAAPGYSTWKTGLSGPFDVAILDGSLYVSEMDGDEVEVFDLATGASEGTITGLSNPTGLAFDADENLYVATKSGATGALISKVAAGGMTVTDADFATLADHRNRYTPWFLTFGPVRLGDNRADQLFPAPDAFSYPQVLYVTDYPNRFIDYVETDGTVNDAYEVVGSARPTGLVFDSIGNLYFAATDGSDYAVFRSVAALPVLPVELTSFEAVADENRVTLRWTTASETNNAGFEVQQRKGFSFERVGFVDGYGTTDREQHYEYMVRDLAPGKHVFRLKQVDYDGVFEYTSEVEVTVEVAGTYEITAAYPNPFNPQTRFTLSLSQDQDVHIAVYDVLGRQVARLHDGWLEATTSHAFTFDGAGLPSGTYFIQTQGETFQTSRAVTLFK